MRRLKLYLLVMVFVFFVACGTTKKEPPKVYHWNGGHCEECGGELMWDSTGNKEHYICNRCGKEYTFDGVKKKR